MRERLKTAALVGLSLATIGLLALVVLLAYLLNDRQEQLRRIEHVREVEREEEKELIMKNADLLKQLRECQLQTPEAIR